MKKINYFRTAFTLLMALYGIVCVSDVTSSHLIDRVDLVMHEAGHLLFSRFGEFLHVLGGTIGQLFVPAAGMVYFLLRRKFFFSAVTLFWIGLNLFDISVYMKDARTMAMPQALAAGDDAIHDWNYLFSKAGLLQYDRQFGNVVFGLGLAAVAAAVILAGCFSLRREKG